MSRGLSDHARGLRAELADKALPHWFDTAQDREHGGYLLADAEKQLVTQARMRWGFSHAHRKGFSSSHRNYLAAAELGFASRAVQLDQRVDHERLRVQELHLS